MPASALDSSLRSAWHSQIREIQRTYPRQELKAHALCSPHGIMQGLGRVLTDHTIVTTDVGQHQMSAAQPIDEMANVMPMVTPGVANTNALDSDEYHAYAKSGL